MSKIDSKYFKKIYEHTPVYQADGFELKDINWCTIKTKLIQNAGRFCDDYASDIIIDIESIQEKIKNKELKDGDFFLFGFRESGVDHTDFVLCRTQEELQSVYREIWKMDVKFNPDSYDRVDFQLYRVDYNAYQQRMDDIFRPKQEIGTELSL